VTQDRDAEIVRRLRATFDAFNRGDFDAAIAFMHPDIEFIRAGVQPPLRGVEQVRAWMEPSAFEYQVVEPIDITVAGNKVLVLTNTKARGASSGIEVQIDAWNVFTVDDDLRLTRAETYFLQEEDEARRAAAVADPGSSG
jgi:ketosteroid isomerase-like protein